VTRSVRGVLRRGKVEPHQPLPLPEGSDVQIVYEDAADAKEPSQPRILRFGSLAPPGDSGMTLEDFKQLRREMSEGMESEFDEFFPRH
jgi:hypothetical protein